MTPDTVLDIGQSALEATTVLGAAILIPALLVGLVVAMFQAATQINEMTLTFIPKLIIVVVVLMAAGPWMLRVIMNFTITFSVTSLTGANPAEIESKRRNTAVVYSTGQRMDHLVEHCSAMLRMGMTDQRDLTGFLIFRLFQTRFQSPRRPRNHFEEAGA